MKDKKKSLNNLDSVKIIELPFFPETRGDLSVIQTPDQCPFEIARVFSVRAPVNEVRGEHAHKECTQLIICLNGSVEVTCDDSNNSKTYILDKPSIGLYVPTDIWQIQKYVKPETVVLFLCDQPYNIKEYINDYNDFLDYKSFK